MKNVFIFFLNLLLLMNPLSAQMESPAAGAVAEQLINIPAVEQPPEQAVVENPLKEAVVQTMIKEMIKVPTPKGHDFMTLYRSLINEARSQKNLKGPSCIGFFEALVDVVSTDNKKIDYEWLRQYGLIALNASFNARKAFHESINVLTSECRLKLREVYREMRMAEDLIGSIYYRTKPLTEAEIAQIDKYIPILDQKNLNPPLVPENFPKGNFKYKSGDVFMVKGKMIQSSVITEVSTPRSGFSHLALVHVNEKTNEVSVLQNFGNTFLRKYSLKEFLEYDNQRIVLFRPTDAEAGKRAANYVYNKILENQKKQIEITYDFNNRFDDESEQDCVEVVYHGYRNGNQNKFIVPEMKSSISLNSKNLTEWLMVKNGSRMFPADLEVDTRFKIEWEWTNYKLIRESWMKDALVSEIYRWTDELKYKFKENMYTYRNKILWSLRYVPGLWDIILNFTPHFNGVHKSLPADMLRTVYLFKSLEKVVLKSVQQFDRVHFEQNGRWLSFDELKAVIEKFRANKPQVMSLFFDMGN